MTLSVFELLKLAPKFINDTRSLPFAETDIPDAVVTELAEQIHAMLDDHNDSFGPWGKRIARWADQTVPVVLAAIAKGVEAYEVVEDVIEEVIELVEDIIEPEAPVETPVVEEPVEEVVEEPVVEKPAKRSRK